MTFAASGRGARAEVAAGPDPAHALSFRPFPWPLHVLVLWSSVSSSVLRACSSLELMISCLLGILEAPCGPVVPHFHFDHSAPTAAPAFALAALVALVV